MNRLLLSTILSFFLFISVSAAVVAAEEVAVKKAAAEDTQAAENELLKLEQAIGEDAVVSPETRSTKDVAGDSEAKTEEAEKEAAEKAEAKKDEESSKPWLPAAKKFDWVQLTSGEWLKGEIKSMYNDSLEFDSDKLDLLSIDWEDVKYLKSYRPSGINIEGHEPLTGSLQISDDAVTITHDGKIEEFSRHNLISLTPSGNSELDLWAIKLSLALNLRSGNTKQLDYTAKFSAKRRTAKTRFVLDYIGNISKTGDENRVLTETVNNHRVIASHNIYATRYFFYQPIFAEYYRDPFQNIDQRITAGVGMGYTIFNTGRFEWNVAGGPAYVGTNYISVLPGEKQKIDAAALVFATDFDAELTSTLDYIFKYRIQAANKESGGYTHHIISTFESEITGSLDFDISLIWDRISQPTKDDQGNSPKPDDYRLTVGITYTY
ncbi:MAG: DUF481 domain-containing protein [Gammaproteobacteria bacterium]